MSMEKGKSNMQKGNRKKNISLQSKIKLEKFPAEEKQATVIPGVDFVTVNPEFKTEGLPRFPQLDEKLKAIYNNIQAEINKLHKGEEPKEKKNLLAKKLASDFTDIIWDEISKFDVNNPNKEYLHRNRYITGQDAVNVITRQFAEVILAVPTYEGAIDEINRKWMLQTINAWRKAFGLGPMVPKTIEARSVEPVFAAKKVKIKVEGTTLPWQKSEEEE